MIQRRNSRKIRVGAVEVGGGAPVSVQSMTNTDTRDVAATLAQIVRLMKAGCDIVRVAVDDRETAAALAEITEVSPLPVIADIQFDHTMAIAAIQSHAAGIRLNPGFLHSECDLRPLARAVIDSGVPVRIGANSGSIRPELVRAALEKGMDPDSAMAEALVSSALENCEKLEKLGIHDIKVAVKAPGVPVCVKATRLLAERTDYPLHLGVTEAGIPSRGIVKSAVGIGSLLLDGIGDTIRVSLTAPPEEEAMAGVRILEAVGMRDAMPEIISCPTCGRTEFDLVGLANRVEDLVADIKAAGKNLKRKQSAVLGGPGNGPGEARSADLGIAGSRTGKVVIFRRGEVVGAYNADEGFEYFRLEILKSCE